MHALKTPYSLTRAVAIIVSVVIATASVASAHGTASSARPRPGDVVESVDIVILQFDEPLLDDGQFLVRIHDADRGVIFVKDLSIEGGQVLTGIVDPPLGDGDYELSYSVMFADGEHTEDAYSFRVTGGGPDWWVVTGALGLALAALATWGLARRELPSRPRAVRV